MALRSLLRKTPALGVRSWPTAPTVQKLSPAAGSRLMSTDLPSAEEGEVDYSQGTLSAQREEINRMRAEFDQTMKEINCNIDACDEAFRRDAQDYRRFLKEHETIRKTCNVILLLCVPAAILVSLV